MHRYSMQDCLQSVNVKDGSSYLNFHWSNRGDVSSLLASRFEVLYVICRCPWLSADSFSVNIMGSSMFSNLRERPLTTGGGD